MSTNSLESKDTVLNWSITSSLGKELLIPLPRTVRSFEDFMRVDIATGDSDPIYWAVARARLKWGDEWAARFCVAMLCYYHSGVAVRAAEHEGPDFWKHLKEIYTTAPRGSERRHFRGDAGFDALERYQAFAPRPEFFFNQLGLSSVCDYAHVRSQCEKYLPQCGPYFILKICDFMDRCLGIEIFDWKGLERNLPTEPQRAFGLLETGGSFNQLVEQMRAAQILAAPDFTRLVGPAEVETSLCGWKTTKFKGNWFGRDIAEKRAQLIEFGCNYFAELLPSNVPRDAFELKL